MTTETGRALLERVKKNALDGTTTYLLDDEVTAIEREAIGPYEVALLRYGRHENSCPEVDRDPPWDDCECGWATVPIFDESSSSEHGSAA